MDSPPDLSPNAPPAGMENPAEYFGALHAQDIRRSEERDAANEGVASSNDSVDSSGFEKVDATSDLLADYTANFHNQMQQSLYGQLPEDPFARSYGSSDVDLLGGDDDSTYEVVDPREIEVLTPTFADIDEKPKRLPEPTMDPHGSEELRKSFGDVSKVDDLIGHLAEQEGAQAVAKAVEEAPKAVEDFLKHDDTWNKEAADDFEDFLHDKPPQQQHDSPVSPSGDSGRDTVGKLIGEASDDEDAPAFGGQTPEETTFDRQGPLTIPADLIEQDEEPDVPVVPEPFGTVPTSLHHHGFETVARPPTPPKDISDEDVKPSTIHPGHHETPTHSHRSILKHGSSVHGSHPTAKGPWFDFKTVDPRVLDLIYWRDPKKSGIALGAILAVLFIFTRFPLITVLSYAGLAALTGTIAFRVIKGVQAQINKTETANPFQPYLEQELTVPQDRVHEQADVIVEHGQCLARQLRRLFLVENIVDSVKFALLLWSFTYIGAWFSGCTLMFLTVLSIFTVPKIYETYQEPIDAQLSVIKGHIDNVTNTLEEKLPFLKKAAAAAEKKEQ